MHISFLLIFILIDLTSSITVRFSNSLQRFVYHQQTNTILLASINHIYSLNATDLSLLVDLDTSSSITNQQCSRTNRTSSTTTTTKNLYQFSTLSHLIPSENSTFNQLLLPINDSVLICSTTNRGGSCQLRSLINLDFIRNSSERLVASSPFYPSIGLINQNNQILYLSNPYDSQCDPFYEIPTISGRHLNSNEFLSVINFNSGQSALQQSTYTLRLLNIRLIKDFFLYYLYAFEYKHFSYFLTIQQADVHHTQKSNLQTKIIRFCQTTKQPIIKSYVEIPLTCGRNFHYLITGKFSPEEKVFYGLFRNTTLANSTSTSHAICAYSIDDIQQGFFQTIKHCLVDGKGRRGLSYITPDTHCRASKHLNDINEDYCPSETESFSQYPIGGQQAIEQKQPILQLDDRVNFTAIEIGTQENQLIMFLGDDHGVVHTIRLSNTEVISKQKFQSNIILDLKLMEETKLLILTDNQIVKQNLSICEQYSTCQTCANHSLCHWCSKENRCTTTFQCVDESTRNNRMNMCTNIQQIIPEVFSLDDFNTEFKIILNTLLENQLDEYICRFTFDEQSTFFETKATLEEKTMKCLPPQLNNTIKAISTVTLSIYHRETNLTVGSYPLKFIDCSNFQSCISCTSSFNLCLWNRKIGQCRSQPKEHVFFTHYLTAPNQCPSIYLEPSRTYLTYYVDKTLNIHIEQCNQSMSIQSCRLNDHRKRLSLIAFDPVLIQSANQSNSCLLKCFFQWIDIPQISFHRPINLRLSIEFSNETTAIIPNSQISLYQCQHLASNCSSCLQLNPSYGCTWCNNQCIYKNHSKKCFDHHQRCLSPIIDKIEPLILPIHGGTLVTITGRHFDRSQVTVHVANIPCQVVEEESSENKILCQSGDARSVPRTGVVHLKFESSGLKVNFHRMISYIKPKIHSIEPLIGIQNGGTLLTIHGENFTIGNSHISVFIGNRLCELNSILHNKIECKTRAFPLSMLNKTQTIEIVFDRQTKVLFPQQFTIIPNPVLLGFRRYESFLSGGHPLIIRGDNFDPIQNIQLEFHQLIYVSPRFRNNTHLVFLTPTLEQLHLQNPQEILLRIYLDGLNETSTLMYRHDPIVYELQPMFQTYTDHLIIQGMNLTAIGHTKEQIHVHIGCDLCSIVHLQSDQIICRPPKSPPRRYLKNNQRCYNSEHPSIILSIDNIHSHVGYLIYPKKLIWIGVLIGCLTTILIIGLLVLLIIYLKIRFTERKYHQDYLYANRIIPQEIIKEKIYSTLFLPIRSYVNYLQMCFASNHFTSNKTNYYFNEQIFEQFKSLLENNEPLIECFFKHSIATKNDKILNNLILIQRYNLKKLFQFDYHPLIYFNTCILTSYEFFTTNHIHSLFSQLYSQLKSKISSGPIDAIESRMSYYSLNANTIIHEHSVLFKTIQLLVHIDSNNPHCHEVLINLSCLTCDTISQVKQKLLTHLNLSKKIPLEECSLYLITNSSCSSSSSTASSSIPLIRKSMLTQALFNRTIKYSTTTINDPYRESNQILLNDIDNTNEQINCWFKLNTLQHYGILTDGYEMKMIIPNLSHTLQSSCQYCSPLSSMFNYLPLSTSNENPRSEYIHLFNHTYEEIEKKIPSETYRLFETKSAIQSILIQLIENLFNTPIHDETYLSELIKDYRQIFHMFYGHFLPLILRNLHCLLDISVEKHVSSSLDILAMIFQIGCCQTNAEECSLCADLCQNELNDSNIQNCTLVFTEEIQRVRVFYSNLERCLRNETLVSVYSSTNTGVEKTFELDKSIFAEMMEYSYLHANEIIEYLKSQSTDRSILPIFLNLIQMYGNNERT